MVATGGWGVGAQLAGGWGIAGIMGCCIIQGMAGQGMPPIIGGIICWGQPPCGC